MRFESSHELSTLEIPVGVTAIEDYAFGYQTDSAEAGTYSMVKGFLSAFINIQLVHTMQL